MSFENQSNRTRVMKIIEITALIEKSAKSNKATPEQIAELLHPARAQINALCGIAMQAEAPEPDAPATTQPLERSEQQDSTQLTTGEPFADAATIATMGRNPHPWHTVREMAERAPLRDLSLAMNVYLDRLEKAAFEATP